MQGPQPETQPPAARSSATAARRDPRVLFSAQQIAQAVRRMAAEITEVYGPEQELTVLAVLHGALVFTADLIRQLEMPLRLETVTARSYRGTDTTPGRLELRLGPGEHLRERHVLIVDDILDTGRTLERVCRDVARFEPRSLRIATLLDKPSRRTAAVSADFVGFRIPDVFVVGYGLDLDGRHRNLPSIVDPAGAG